MDSFSLKVNTFQKRFWAEKLYSYPKPCSNVSKQSARWFESRLYGNWIPKIRIIPHVRIQHKYFINLNISSEHYIYRSSKLMIVEMIIHIEVYILLYDFAWLYDLWNLHDLK